MCENKMNWQHLHTVEITLRSDPSIREDRSLILPNLFFILEYKWGAKAEEKQNWNHEHLYIYVQLSKITVSNAIKVLENKSKITLFDLKNKNYFLFFKEKKKSGEACACVNKKLMINNSSICYNEWKLKLDRIGVMQMSWLSHFY